MIHSVNLDRVAVLGLGSWGTALAEHLARKGIPCVGWSRDKDEIAHINGERRHPYVHKDIYLSFRGTTELEEALEAPCVVYALPSSAIHEYSSCLAHRDSQVIVSATKGFAPQSTRTTLQSFAQSGAPGELLCALSGPSFAVDLIRKLPLSIVAASIDPVTAEKVAELFASDTVRVYTSLDPVGVELGGSLKNVIAVAAGMCDGLSLGESARAALITRGLAEMTRIISACGGRQETIFGLSGLGDLALTASTPTSRNYTTGYRLGKGEKLEEILASLGQVAEGVCAAGAASKLATELSIEAPITRGVLAVVEGSLRAPEVVKQLMARPRKSEF